MSEGRALILEQVGKRNVVETSSPGVFVMTFPALCYAEYKRRQAKAMDAKKPSECSRLLAEADAYLLVVGLCDSDGKRLFTDADFPELLQLPNGTFQSLVSAVVQVNGIDEISVERSEKNSEATSGDNSPTG